MAGFEAVVKCQLDTSGLSSIEYYEPDRSIPAANYLSCLGLALFISLSYWRGL
jgi:hypothetical protein